MNILIVDDDLEDREHIKRVLVQSEMTCNIIEAISVDEGIARFAESNIDAVLLACLLPQRGGIEMVVEIRNTFKNPRVAIVMMSSTGEEHLALRSLRVGAQDLIIKSDITALQLRHAIQNALTRCELERELRESHKNAKSLSEQDTLTGLSNRYFFEETLKTLARGHRRSRQKFALIIVDIDHFKYINDSFGHVIGDTLLVKAANRIRSCLRGSETFARLGGDEFGILVNSPNSELDVSQVSSRILTVLKKPFEFEGMNAAVSASIGIAIYPNNGNSAVEILKNAGIAMYRAKNNGRNQFCFFQHQMQQKFKERFRIEKYLRTALLDELFELHYQPILESGTGRTMGFEALLRCEVEGVCLLPNTFIPVAEESRLIIDIGRWVIKEAIRQLSLWNASSTYKYSMAINFSPVQFLDNKDSQHIETCLDEYCVDSTLIYIEITETSLIDNNVENIGIIKSIRKLGCRVALDDFGTGFSSITHLINFPISTVKIDRSLMPINTGNSKKSFLLNGLVAMLKHLGLEVVCEGVENNAQRTLCNSLSVDKLQGFYFSKPLKSVDAESFISGTVN